MEKDKVQKVEIINTCIKLCPSKVFLRTRYNYDRKAASLLHGLSCPEPSKAVQSQKEESDINTIVRRFGLTGQLPANYRVPQYGDFTGVGTYHEALNAVIEAQNAFNALPADLKRRFNNDPEQLIQFCSDSNNKDEAIKLGLIPKTEAAIEGAAAIAASTSAANPKVEPATKVAGTGA